MEIKYNDGLTIKQVRENVKLKKHLQNIVSMAQDILENNAHEITAQKKMELEEEVRELTLFVLKLQTNQMSEEDHDKLTTLLITYEKRREHYKDEVTA